MRLIARSGVAWSGVAHSGVDLSLYIDAGTVMPVISGC
jgi:hypothetical protein